MSGDIGTFSECQVTLHKCTVKPHYWKLYSDNSGLNLTFFRATVSLRSLNSLQSEKATNTGKSWT